MNKKYLCILPGIAVIVIIGAVFLSQDSQFKRVGADERDEWVDAVIVEPSERAIIEVLFDTSGTFALQNNTPDKMYSLGTINVDSGSVEASYASEFNRLGTYADTIKVLTHFGSILTNLRTSRLILRSMWDAR